MPSLRSSPTTLTCPTWVLAREPRDEFADITAKRRSTERSIRLGPAASHEPSMPGQQRLRLDEERVPAAPRQHSARRGEKSPIAWFKTRLFDLPAKDRQFMAEYEDLQLRRPLTTAEEHDQLQQAAADDVEGGRNQRRPPADGDTDATAASRAFRGSHRIGFMHPTHVGHYPAHKIAHVSPPADLQETE
jgi:hypothetical protein